MFNRILNLTGLKRESCFLWGARQTGKSTLLKKLFPDTLRYDLLLSTEYNRLMRDPSILRQEVLSDHHSAKPHVIIDEVQKIPQLLDEVQWLMVNHNIPFILCGSSARKLKRSSANLLGGRALRYQLYPLVSHEIPNFDLQRALNHGMLPRHYLGERFKAMLEAYIGDYLTEEIAAEALTRNIPAFARFLEAAAFSNGEMLVYKNIAADCGVNAVTVKEYFQILTDTLLGYIVPAYQKRPKRRVITAPRFYYFDVGVVNYLLKRGYVTPKTEVFGKAFGHFIFQEMMAHSRYSELNYPISYWRTASQLEVDFVLGDHDIAVEIKSTENPQPIHLKGLQAIGEEYHFREKILVALVPRARKIGDITILPWKSFLDRLWSGDLMR